MTTRQHYHVLLIMLVCFGHSWHTNAQAVTGIITDYKGFWKTSLSSMNPVKPNNSHNLLAFTYKGTQYSTGVNNELLASRGENFVAGDFWSLPVGDISGTITSNTKVGVGALKDGVANGASATPPANSIAKYLTDGIKGLDIGTCIANLPQGTLNFYVSNVKPAAIGDGVPDIVVTQIADPSGSSFDRYEFIDQNGNRVGNYKDIVFTSIAPVGNWIADFYEARNNPMVLLNGFTQTERPLRLWAADLSEFGITSGNYTSAKSFRINLSGNSDVAFVAYNYQSMGITTVLPFESIYLKGSIQANYAVINSELELNNGGKMIVLEKSIDGTSFQPIDSIKNPNGDIAYSYTDKTVLSTKSFYRLKLVLQNNQVLYSQVLQLQPIIINNIKVFPNPANDMIQVNYLGRKQGTISLYNGFGELIAKQHLTQSGSNIFDVSGLATGMYYLIVNSNQQLFRQSLSIIH